MKKFKEGYLNKRTGGRYKENSCQMYCGILCRRWLKRWFIVTAEGIIYAINSSSTRIREMLLFDRSFKMMYGRSDTGMLVGLTLLTSTRKLTLKADDMIDVIDWIYSIKQAVKECPYIQPNRFDSFAPEREANIAKWIVDGENYFKEVEERLEKARNEVLIAGWWLSPELHLVRPVNSLSSEKRLDQILARIANRGVKVFVIVYSEVRLALYNDSQYTKLALESLSPNIKVLRHPNDVLFMWSHHEKVIIIDQNIGFIGGIDLCYGRYDTRNHPLNDPCNDKGNGELYPGIDYNNARIADFKDVKNFKKGSLDKKIQPRLPWHDVAMMMIGGAVRDLARHFIQYWNFAKLDIKSKKDEYFLTPSINTTTKLSFSEKVKEKFSLMLGSSDPPDRSTDNYFELNHDEITETESIIVIKKENQYDGEIMDDMETIQDEDEKNDKEDTVQVEMTGSSSKSISNGSNKYVKKNSLQRHNKLASSSDYRSSVPLRKKKRRKMTNRNRSRTTMIEKTQYNALLVSATEKEIETVQQTNIILQENDSQVEEVIPQDKIDDQIFEDNMLQLKVEENNDQKLGTCNCQILRSATTWSIGIKPEEGLLENSIQNAYISLISRSKRFIYIENQFFISSTAGPLVNNGIAKALVLRIQEAHKAKEKFKIVIFLPLLPGFAGEIEDPKSSVLRIQLHWEQMTISKAQTSVFQELKKSQINPDDYIGFYSLRKHGKMNDGLPVTEMIYVHSKIMIVDDEIAIIGSANINDRSMQGSRDSEVAVILEDTDKIKFRFGGDISFGSKFAHSLRVSLYQEHLNLSADEVEDPLDDELCKRIIENAKSNTKLFREIFACYPDNTVKKLDQIKDFKLTQNLKKYDELSPKIKGNIVEYPVDFLCDEDLNFKRLDKEFYVPIINFT